MKNILFFVFACIVGINFSHAQERAAVGKFKSQGELTPSESSTLRSSFQSALVKTEKYEVAELDDQELTNVQRQFEAGAYNDRDQSVKLGEAVKANIVFAGIIGKLGSTYTVTINMYDVTKKTITKTENFKHQGELDELLTKIEESAQKIAGTFVESNTTWYYIGGAVLVGGGAAAVLLGKKKADDTVLETGLPDPPSKPN